jgi:hypothetical protein
MQVTLIQHFTQLFVLALEPLAFRQQLHSLGASTASACKREYVSVSAVLYSQYFGFNTNEVLLCCFGFNTNEVFFENNFVLIFIIISANHYNYYLHYTYFLVSEVMHGFGIKLTAKHYYFYLY